MALRLRLELSQEVSSIVSEEFSLDSWARADVDVLTNFAW